MRVARNRFFFKIQLLYQTTNQIYEATPVPISQRDANVKFKRYCIRKKKNSDIGGNSKQ